MNKYVYQPYKMAETIDRFNNVYSQFLDELEKLCDFKRKLSPTNFLKNYVCNILPQMDNISVCNEDFFTHSNLILVSCGKSYPSVTFKNILKVSQYKKNRMTKINFWKYLHTLYLLSTKLTSEIEALLDDEEISSNKDKIRCVLDSHKNLINNLKQYRPDKIFIEQAVVPTEKKNSSHASASSPAPGMGGLPGMGGGLPGMSPDFLQNSLIGKLANDLSKDFNEKDFASLNSPADILSSFFGGGGDGDGDGMGGLGNIMKTICTKMDQKIKSGELNQHDLMSEAQQLMGGFMGGMAPNTDCPPPGPGASPPGAGMPSPGANPPGMNNPLGAGMPSFAELAKMTPDQLRRLGANNMMNAMNAQKPNPKHTLNKDEKEKSKNTPTKGVIIRKKK